ncbi:oligopeptide/dipeptide ABC transporter ATP-binding protein [Thermoactinospora rubra]|uniref:oligopeptide/dipeptide ABC transporter ATP-binding protein n=1 Tax=Thermoactinospora rubra TaxID=1088767 RepID=UPI000A0FEADB|nr:oligopeptide/dipeptide ABC transporter ATP-binding protein [Thermoactinospora rubra]
MDEREYPARLRARQRRRRPHEFSGGQCQRISIARALLAASPGGGLGLPPADRLISGEPPSPVSPPTGCRFRTRCPRAAGKCAQEEPEMRPVNGGHYVACHFPVAP